MTGLRIFFPTVVNVKTVPIEPDYVDKVRVQTVARSSCCSGKTKGCWGSYGGPRRELEVCVCVWGGEDTA